MKIEKKTVIIKPDVEIILTPLELKALMALFGSLSQNDITRIMAKFDHPVTLALQANTLAKHLYEWAVREGYIKFNA